RTHRTLRAGLASFTLGTSRSLPPGRYTLTLTVAHRRPVTRQVDVGY
ncbi:MAG: hypothetical protein JWR63_4531, partial [Conexibacter sp.]|nr:hypothetical protein [Conexibacter sp.]